MYVDSINVKLERQKTLVSSMIMISENAALKDSNIIDLNLCHNCDQQECQDVISMKQEHFFHCDLKHKHDQSECDSVTCRISLNKAKFSHTFYRNRNYNLWVNNKMLISKI